MRFHAKGTFAIGSWEDVTRPGNLDSEGFEDVMATFTRTYSGDFSGSGRCQSVTTRSGPDRAVRVGVEIFEGTVQGRTGRCSFTHRTAAEPDDAPWLRWTIGGGKDGLAGIQGHGEIVMTDEETSYSFEYDFDAPEPPAEPAEPAPRKRRKRFWAP
jgi:hypothetical protein